MSKLHITVGIYPNGSWKANCVPESKLEAHIAYQTLRPGRMFLVDGEIINHGMGVDTKYIEPILGKVAKLNLNTDSTPYV